MPSGSVSPVTRPNSVNTPTFPVGIDVVLASSRIITSARIASCNILFPAPLKLILGNPSPPNSNLVGFGIFPSVLRLIHMRFEPRHRHFIITQHGQPRFPASFKPLLASSRPFFNSRESRDRLRNQTFHAPATLPQYLVVFSLDTTAVSRHNPRHHVYLPCAFFRGVFPGLFRMGFWPTRGAQSSLGAAAFRSHLN